MAGLAQSAGADGEGAARVERIESVLRAARDAEQTLARGAPERALALYRELAGRGITGLVADDAPGPSTEERLSRARRSVAGWLRQELAVEIGRSDAAWLVLRRVLVVMACGALAIPVLVRAGEHAEVGVGARWVASSHVRKARRTGVLPHRGFFFSPPPYFFHTREDDEPWLSIDLGKAQTVTAVELRNRLDCCRDRALGVSVELGKNAQSMFSVAKYSAPEPFRTWRVAVLPTVARFVRIVGTPHQSLHLSDVQVFGP